MIDPNDKRFLFVPNSPYVVLAEDKNLAQTAMREGTILLETSLYDLPEMLALKRGDRYLDIGAFVGDTSVIPASKGCRVYSFEPFPDAFECLRHNCPWDNVHKYNVAVGDGSSISFADELGEPASGNLGTRMLTASGVGVPSVRIDDLNFNEVALAKIDVEGFEIRVLRGMKETIKRCHPTIIVEAYDTLLAKQGFTRKDLIEFFNSVNYIWRVCIGRWEDDRCDLIAQPLGV